MNSFDTLIYLKNLLLRCLEELKDADADDQFCCGSRIAYVECLEALSLWEFADIDFDVEERYPIA